MPRATEIEYSDFDIGGNPVNKIATGFEARILQHEIDRLNDILFFEQVEDKESFTTIDKLLSRQQP